MDNINVDNGSGNRSISPTVSRQSDVSPLPTVRPPANMAAADDTKQEYASRPGREFECPVCGEIVRYPVKFPACGHSCCTSCLKELARVEPRCPIDQIKIDIEAVTPDTELVARMNSLNAHCPNKDKLCPWIGPKNETQLHLESCDFVVVPCALQCEVRFERRFQKNHLSDDCIYRMVRCGHCDESIRADKFDGHLETDCSRVELPCILACGKKVPREEMQTHCETTCGNQTIKCPFTEAGCTYEASRKDVRSHLKNNPEVHLGILIQGLLDFKQAARIHDNTLEEQRHALTGLKERLDYVERVYGGHVIWKIDAFSAKMVEAIKGKKTTVYSPPFFTSRYGYKIVVSICPNGQGPGQGTHLSAFVSICKGDYDSTLRWPFSGRVTFTLLDQENYVRDRQHVTYHVKPNVIKSNMPFLGRPIMERNASFGAVKFVEHETLDVHAERYIRDDVMFLKVEVDGEELLFT